MKKSRLIIITIFIVLFWVFNFANAQETQTLFGPKTEVSFVRAMEFKTSSIQDDIGVAVGFYGGALINHSTLFGLSAGFNLSHPKVNHGYLALLTQYTHNPNELLHFSGQMLLGIGSTRDYEQSKTNLFDNFANVFGPGFLFIEPGINAELNFTNSTRLVIGLSYRLAGGLDEDDELIDKTKVTDKDLSGLNFNIGVKLGIY